MLNGKMQYYKFQFICNTPSFLERTEGFRRIQNGPKELLLNFYCVFVQKEVLLRSKNLLAHFGCAKKPFRSFRMDKFFPFVANELKFVVTPIFIFPICKDGAGTKS
jgi:hypothetical protein